MSFECGLLLYAECRHVWLARNVFTQKSWSTGELLARTRAMLAWGNPTLTSLRAGERRRDCYWTPLRPGIIKINTDGSQNVSGWCPCGGLLCDEGGELLTCFMYKVGPGSVISAEACGVQWRLKIATEHGFKQVLVETDCSELLQLLRSPISYTHPDYDLLREVLTMIGKDWDIEVTSVEGKQMLQLTHWRDRPGR